MMAYQGTVNFQQHSITLGSYTAYPVTYDWEEEGYFTRVDDSEGRCHWESENPFPTIKQAVNRGRAVLLYFNVYYTLLDVIEFLGSVLNVQVSQVQRVTLLLDAWLAARVEM